MLGALWGTSSTTALPFSDPASQLDPEAPLFGPLTQQDLEWTCAGGFVTETQVFYVTTAKGQIIMCQVIHSAVGLWYPQIQFTFGLYDTSNPDQPSRTWKSINVTNFVTPPPHLSSGTKLDKRSAKSDQFTITFDPSKPDSYHIQGKYDDEVNVDFTVERLSTVPGWKLGSGPRGGMSYFGTIKPAKNTTDSIPDGAAGTDGYVVHRFWPRCNVKGIVRVGKELLDLDKSSKAIFIHAIQGMRPNLVATRWNFADFHSEGKDDVSLVLMQFTTPANYGKKTVTIGSVVVDEKLVSVSVGTDENPGTKASHVKEVDDEEAGYKAPHEIAFEWSGPPIGHPRSSKDLVKASIHLNVTSETSTPQKYKSKGLVERVDVLAEIPYLVKKVVNVVAGTKPYIYQWLNPAEAKVSIPALNESPARELTVKGYVYNESSFISEP